MSDEKETTGLASNGLFGVCVYKCGVCAESDHHWLEDCDDKGEPRMVCKHCSAVREYTDEDVNFYSGER